MTIQKLPRVGRIFEQHDLPAVRSCGKKNFVTGERQKLFDSLSRQFYNQLKILEVKILPKYSAEATANRREEIINACEKLYRTQSFKDITIIDIGEETSFTRTSIYNYFNTKEEIFLALLQREYELWIANLEKIVAENDFLSKEKFADALAQSLENREQLLKLMSMNHFDLEMNSCDENLIDFKKSYGKSLRAVKNCLDKFCPEKSEVERQNFLYAFFPFVYGIYPYAVVTDRQKHAMKEADVNFKFHSIYQLAYNCILKLLS